jgi:hypothetical protein
MDMAGKAMPGIKVSANRNDEQPESQPEAGAKRGRRELTKTQQKITEVSGCLKKTDSRPDGTFFFLDCPDGQYTVTAEHPQSGVQDQKTVSVAKSTVKKKTKDRGTEEGYQIALSLKK